MPTRPTTTRAARRWIHALLLVASAGVAHPAMGAAQDPVPAPGALPPDSAARPGVPAVPSVDQRYRIYLLTMDQGDEVWEMFGHNAILIRDAVTGQDLVWNWGLFNFGDVDFVPRLLQGTMLYSMGPSELLPFLEAYRRADRTVYANEVLLTRQEARALDEFVRWNYRPENRDYLYNYYLDNCSTRVRDALDVALGGILRDRYENVLTPFSFRWHSRRLVQETTWVDQGLSLMIGMPAERPITQWEAMFLPLELMRHLEDFERPDGEGGVRPLLGPREVLHQATRAATPEAPPRFSLVWPFLGLAGAALLVALAIAGERWSWAGAGLWATSALWGMFSGVLGLLLFLVWFTDHFFAQWNVNLFYMSPLALPLAALATAALVRRRWRRGTPGRLAAGLAVAIALGSLLMVLAEATPWIGQWNAEVVAVAVPVNLALAWALWRRTYGRPDPGSSQQ